MVSRSTVKRIARDLKEMHKSPVAGCGVALVEDGNLAVWRVAITCPTTAGCKPSAWNSVPAIVQLEFPDGYPAIAPQAFFLTDVPFSQGASARDDRGWQFLCLSLLGGTFAGVHREWAADTTHGWNPVIGSAKLVITMLQALMYQEEAINSAAAATAATLALRFEDSATGHCGSDRSAWFPAVAVADDDVTAASDDGGEPATGAAMSAATPAAAAAAAAQRDYDAIASATLCYASRARFDEADTVLGYGVLHHPRAERRRAGDRPGGGRRRGGGLHVGRERATSTSGALRAFKADISCPCELLSASSFLDDRVRETTQRAGITHYIPLYLDAQHWLRARSLFEAAMQQLTSAPLISSGDCSDPSLCAVALDLRYRQRCRMRESGAKDAGKWREGCGRVIVSAKDPRAVWGTVVGIEESCFRLSSGSNVKKASEGTQWCWQPLKAAATAPMHTTQPGFSAMQVLPRLINLTVVGLNNGELHGSEHLLFGLTQLFRVLLQVVLENPGLRDDCDARVRAFIGGATSKAVVPDIGEFLVTLALAPSFDWREVIPLYLRESSVRHVKWAAMKHPELGQTCERTREVAATKGGVCGYDERGKAKWLKGRPAHTASIPVWKAGVHAVGRQYRGEAATADALFDATQTSRGLICFQKFFLERVARPTKRSLGKDESGDGPDGGAALASLEEVAATLDARLGRPMEGEAVALQQAWRRIKSISSWDAFYAELGLPIPTASQLSDMHTAAALTSHERGYHTCLLEGAPTRGRWVRL